MDDTAQLINGIEASSNETLKAVISGIAVGVIAVDFEHKITVFNLVARQITAYTTEEVMGKSIDDVLQMSEGERLITIDEYCPNQMANQYGVVFRKDNIKLLTARAKAYVDISTSHIPDGRLYNIHSIFTLHDVTNDHRLDALKLDFVSMAAHELRTPLTAIKGYQRLLMNELQNTLTPEQKEYIHRLNSSTANLSSLIDNLLNVSRIEKGTFKIEPSPIEVNNVIETVVRDLEEQANTKNQKLVLKDTHASYPKVLADPFRITQVLNNLVANAINYTPTGGTITISIANLQQTTPPSDFLAISVQDTGQGIPQDALPRLFTKFFRATSALEQGSKGTGLGLYISKSIVQMHKGKIWVNSTPNVGSTFTFTLPIATVEDIKLYEQASTKNGLYNQYQGIIINPYKQ